MILRLTRVVLMGACLCASADGRVATPTLNASAALPSRVLWAWERPEHFEFLTDSSVAVAFLTQTIRMEGPTVTVMPRRQPLMVLPVTPLIAVTRIEMDSTRGGRPSQDRLEWIAGRIANAAAQPQVVAVQVDFDATVSQRGVYSEIIRATRARLAPGVPLSMTALASWCTEPGWLESLPVDEIVPMMFQMGPVDRGAFRELGEERSWPLFQCRQAIGISTTEPMRTSGAGRTYIFNTKAWDRASAAAALRFTGDAQ
jgi:hypothetical protein